MWLGEKLVRRKTGMLILVHYFGLLQVRGWVVMVLMFWDTSPCCSLLT